MMKDDDATGRATGDFRRLDPRVVTLWRLTMLGASLAVIAGGLIIGRLAESMPVTVAGLGVGLALAAGALVWPRAKYRAWSFRVGARDVRLRYGVLWRTVSVVPYARIQHVDTRRGPLERWLGLARVILFTAGTSGASLTIPGLDAADAESLRDRLAELSGTEDAV